MIAMLRLFVLMTFALLLTASAWADVNPCPSLAHAKTVQVMETTWYRTEPRGLQPVTDSQVQMVIPVPGTATLNPAKPINMRIECRPIMRVGSKYVVAHPPHPSILVTDGKTKWEYFRPGNVFRKDRIGSKKFYGSAWMSQWNFTMPTLVLFSRASQKSGPFSWFKSAGRTVLDGKPMRLYRYMSADEVGDVSLEKLWVDAATNLPYRSSSFHAEKGKPLVESERFDYRDWSLNQPIPAARFSWNPPPTAKEYVPPKRMPLLADDMVAPDFTVQDKDGQPLRLADYKGKTVVLDFWATWCGPCQFGMRRTLPVAKKYVPQGVVFLAVNVWDKKAEFTKWLSEHREYAPLTFAIDTRTHPNDIAGHYQVSGIPAQFVIDKDGKIVAGLSGFGGQELERAIQAATGEMDREAYRSERASLKKMMQDMQ